MFFYNQKVKSKCGFTLAEVLITLVIIGIISSMTIPTIMANTRKTEVETKLKHTYSLLNNALTRAVADNGPIYTWDETSVDMTDDKHVSFFINYIAPYLNFAKPLKYTTQTDYGYKSPVKSGKTKTFDATTKKWMATLNNGVVLFASLHGTRVTDSTDSDKTLGFVAVSYAIDLNGIKGPNQAGRDIFLYSLYINDRNPKFEMHGLTKSAGDTTVGTYDKQDRIPHTKDEIEEYCGHASNGWSHCGALIQRNGWKIPKDYPIRI